jgi:hypothetical protein
VLRAMQARELVAKATWFLAIACAASGLAFLVFGVWARPYTEIESQLVFEAHRIRAHLPLYSDPIAGAWEGGAPPSHYFVPYPPGWAYLLAAFPATTLEGTRTAGRIVSVLLYVATLVTIVRNTRAENRRATLVGACLALGLDLIVREAGLAQTDVPAVALTSFALVRTARHEKLDAISAAMFAATPLVKHSIVGAALGALIAHGFYTRREGLRAMVRPLLAGAAVATAIIGAYEVVSGGAWLPHIFRATGQSLSFERWTHEVGSRFILLGTPHAVVLAIAVRRRASAWLTLPLATSLVCTLVALAKHGSATHYWQEPTMVALVVVSRMPPPHQVRSARLDFALASSGLALAIAVAASSIPSFAAAPVAYERWDDSRRAADAACPRSAGEVVMSSDVRMEVALDGRPIIPAWETTYMVRSGTFPLETWRREVSRPEVKCLLMDSRFYDPIPRGDAAQDVSVYRTELRETVDALFTAGPAAGGWILLVRRPREARNM